MQRILGRVSSAVQGLSITGSSSKKPPADPETDIWVQTGPSNEERRKAQERVWDAERRSKPRTRVKLEALTGRTGPHVDISNLRLTTLPPSLSRLTTVQDLDLSRNNLTAFPEVLGIIAGNLEKLNISFNRIPNIPPTVDSLRKLTSLDASNNQISFIDGRIRNLTNLEVMNLSRNELAAVPPEFAFLSRLKDLSLAKNHLEEVPALEHLRGLKRLDLSENPLQFIDKRRDPENQLRFPVNLETLLLCSTHLKDEVDHAALPEHMGFLEKLQVLDLSSNPELRELPLEFGTFRLAGKNQVTSSRLTVKFKDTQVLEGLVEGARLPAGTPPVTQPQTESAAGGSIRWDQPVDWSHPVAQQVMRTYTRQLRRGETTPTPPPWLGGRHPSSQVPPPGNFAVPPISNPHGWSGQASNYASASPFAQPQGLQPPYGEPSTSQPGMGPSVQNPANPTGHMGLNDLVNAITLIEGLPRSSAEGRDGATSDASRQLLLGELKDEVVKRVMANGSGLLRQGGDQGVTPSPQYQASVPAQSGLYPSGYASQPYPTSDYAPQPYPAQTQVQGGLYANSANAQGNPPVWTVGPDSFQPAAGTAYQGQHWDLLQKQSYDTARDYLANQICSTLPALLPQRAIDAEVLRITAEENGPKYRYPIQRSQFETTQAIRNRLIGQLGRSLYRQHLVNQLAIETMKNQPERPTNAQILSVAYQTYLAESLDLPGPIRALYDDLKAKPPRLQADIFDGIVPDPDVEIERIYNSVESEETSDLDGGKYTAWLNRQEFWKEFTKEDSRFLINAMYQAYQ